MFAYRTAALLAGALLTGGCATAPAEPMGSVEIIEDKVPIDWKTVATPADTDRLARVDAAWSTGLAAARRFSAAVAKEGPLLDPNASLPRAAPTPGSYQCRIVRLGGRPAFAAFKPFFCFVGTEGELLTIVKQTGTQRPAGRLWPDSDARLVFLGAVGAGAGAAPPYAANPARDLAGHVERIGDFRWRLAVPWPQNGAAIEIYELTPAIPPT